MLAPGEYQGPCAIRTAAGIVVEGGPAIIRNHYVIYQRRDVMGFLRAGAR